MLLSYYNCCHPVGVKSNLANDKSCNPRLSYSRAPNCTYYIPVLYVRKYSNYHPTRTLKVLPHIYILLL